MKDILGSCFTLVFWACAGFLVGTAVLTMFMDHTSICVLAALAFGGVMLLDGHLS